jgi:multidrug transporter EmrE-like cation transporter
MSQHVFGLLLVMLAVFLEALGQLCFKHSANKNRHGEHPLGVIRSAVQNHWMISGIACFLTEAVIWTIALTKLPLSIAFPAGSLGFVFVALLSRAFLGERVGRLRWMGIALILAGVTLVSVRIP